MFVIREKLYAHPVVPRVHIASIVIMLPKQAEVFHFIRQQYRKIVHI
jgi:hypothetical protein